MTDLEALLAEVRACIARADLLPLVVQLSATARQQKRT